MRIAYVSDVEGHWEYFCNYVDLSGALRFRTGGDHRGARTPEDLELELQDGWHFVFGGDSCDKGPGTLRFLEALVRLKRRWPDRVHFLLGNRDINKLRFTSELAEAELARLAEVPGAYWVPEKSRKSPLQFLTELAAQEEGVEQGQVTQDMVRRRNTKANKLRFMLKHDMGSDGEFEFRRDELAHLRGVSLSQVTDEEVVESYEASLRPGGWMREYLLHGQLALLLGDALFVHAQIIGNQFPPSVAGADANGVAWCLGVVPGEPKPVADVRAWVEQLNAWAAEQLREWTERPAWDQPPRAPTYEDWRGRGASELISYGTPASRVPTVVYSRWLTPTCMPLQYPPELVEHLQRNGVSYVIVGHTPHGNCPTVIQNGAVTVVMGDTSFSHMNANMSYKGDNRGTAVSDIIIDGHVCRIKGLTADERVLDYKVAPNAGDMFVGVIQGGEPTSKRFFVKASLPETPFLLKRYYLLCSVNGFTYEYAVLDPDETRAALENSGLHIMTQRTISGSGELFGHSFDGDDGLRLLMYIFEMLDRDRDGYITRRELITACTDKLVRDALLLSFPGRSAEVIMELMDMDSDGGISLEEFLRTFRHEGAHEGDSGQGGIFFRILGSSASGSAGGSASSRGGGVGGDSGFPSSLGPLVLVPTRALQPADFQVVSPHRHQGLGSTAPPLRRGSFSCRADLDCQLELAAGALRTEALRHHVAGGQPGPAAGAPLRGYASPPRALKLGEAQRTALGLPALARRVAWSYAHVVEGSGGLPVAGPADPDVAFLSIGGFVFFDEDGVRVVALRAAVPVAQAAADGGPALLAFGPPERWLPEWTEELRCANRWHAVTQRELRRSGAAECCFLAAGEAVGDAPSSDAGALVFIGRRLTAPGLLPDS